MALYSQPEVLYHSGTWALPSGWDAWRSSHMSNAKYPGCLGYIGDYTTQLYGDFNEPL